MGLRETLGLSGNGDTDLRDQLRRQTWQSELLTEDLRKLELAMEDEGWRRLSMEMDREFSRSSLNDLMKISRAMYLSHPLIQRAVNVRTYYTWGQGVTFDAHDDRIQEEVVDYTTENEYNRCELYSHQARLLTDVDQMVDGNIFLALFTNDNGDIDIRSIPAEEVIDIYTKPGDRQRIQYYRRSWSQREFNEATGTVDSKQYEALYPDIRFQPKNQPAQVGRLDVHWEAPIIHQRTGGLKQMRFGVPETYAALDWARAYKRFLEDWHTIVRSLATFAWRMTAKGSKVKDAKRRLSSTITSENPVEQNEPDAPGSIFIAPEGTDMTPIPKSGALTSSDDAKPSRLMVASAMDLPDTILSGDPQQGNLATAKTLDRPTELSMASRQMMWADLDARIFRYVVDAKVRRGKLPGRVIRGPDESEVEPSIDPQVDVTFPPILEHDVMETVNALVTAATLGGKAEAGTIPHDELSKQLMNAVGVEDVQAALEDLSTEEQQVVQQTVEKLAEALSRA